MGPGPHQGKKVVPSFELLKRQVSETTPEWAETITSIPAERIRKLALEMADTAFGQEFELPIQWTDSWGQTHESVTGRPVAFHAMRGLSAHSNGFQTTRGLAVLMSLLGTIDRPGGFRHKAPYPRQVPPNAKPPSSEKDINPNTPLAKPPLGWPTQLNQKI
jgi:anaerobic selenocysteine-containing dehydrogenase